MLIRMAEAGDAAAVRAVYAPCVLHTAISFELTVPSEAEMAARITDRQPHHPWLVLDDGGTALGYAYAGRFSGRAAYDWAVEASVYLDETVRGRGAGRALYTALFGLLTAQGYRRLLAGITLPNAASVALHESMGLTPAGVYRRVGWKFDRWHDVGWWQCSLADDEHDGDGPAAPVPYAVLPAERYESAIAAGTALLR